MTQAMERREGADAPDVNGTHRSNRNLLIDFWRSAVGKKWVMALTGVGLMGFVFAHMFGNLKMFLGRTEFDHYAEGLRSLFSPILPHTWALWALRIGLIVMFALHIIAAAQLTAMNRRSRPIRYQSPRDYIAANFASRTMRWTGVIVLLYLLFHLADLTWGWVNPDFVRGAAYDNLVASLEQWPVAIIYLIGNIALGIHLFHGAWSMFQSMGINSPRYNGVRKAFAAGFVVVTIGMNCAFVVAIQAGVVSN
ncbi:succinate dehydrogenase cytochrome b subunit [Dermatobacter hominis]|uniref:succinate dehydrogenase cytochrome b subunit n=1 Tax=Dermatobacter hominis TaxID=2884263 RepID=UPI001D0F61E4|nr:succinate dehydrogenase cytochrome b subunit [Dermatobacter hominis]UDY37907.1 succinate dehydrogenase cytochrome b subunit [Dermatobacter hominis]